MSYFNEVAEYQSYSHGEADFHFIYNSNSGGGQSFLGGQFLNEIGKLSSPTILDGHIGVFCITTGEVHNQKRRILLNDAKSRYEIKPRGEGSTSMKLGVGTTMVSPNKLISSFFMLPPTCTIKTPKNLDISILTSNNYWLQSMWLECGQKSEISKEVYLMPIDFVFCGGNSKESSGIGRYFKLDAERRIADIISLSENTDRIPEAIRQYVKLFAEIYTENAPFEYNRCCEAISQIMVSLSKDYPDKYTGIEDPLPFLMHMAFPDATEYIQEPASNNKSSLQVIYYGAPGTGKSYKTKEVTAKYPDTIRVTFHPDTDYASFVGTYKPTTIKEILYGLNGNVTVPLQFNGNPIMASKIEYKFVKQAFLKAYIRAWKKICDNKIAPSLQPIQLSFSIANAQYTITDADANGLRYTKNDIISKRKVQNVWKDLWVDGQFSIPTGPQPGKSVEQAIAKWLNENIENCTSEDFEKGWDKLIGDLRSNKSVDAKKEGGQTYILMYNDATSVTFMTEKTKEKSRISECYLENKKAVGAEIGIIELLEAYDAPNFDVAWEKLTENAHAGSAEETTPTYTPQFLVIEEINRGNCAQIFGDLFQLLDRCGGFSEYPIEADEDIRKALLEDNPSDGLSFGSLGLTLNDDLKDYINKLYGTTQGIADKIAKGQVLVLPPNLYIWATMNTSDQSLFPIDSAFKRRWDWKYMAIKDMKKNYKIVVKESTYDWWMFICKMNQHINSLTSSEDKKLGYFFVHKENGKITAQDFVNKVLFYLYNDALKDYSVGLNVLDENKKLKAANFSDFYDAKGDVMEDKVIEALNDFLRVKEELPQAADDIQ